MKICVKLFAVARELAGDSEIIVEVHDHATIAELQRAVVAACPRMDRIMPHSRWSLDADFVTSDVYVHETSELALIPPVSGG